MTLKSKVSLRGLYKIFGSDDKEVLPHVKAGMGKEELLASHQHVLGLQDINVEMQAGKITVVMGLSGSGKSTLIRHLNRLIEPTDGEILVDGVDIMHLTTLELRHMRQNKMSMVFQKFALLPHRTVLQNAAMALDIKGVAAVEQEREAQKWLNRVGLGGYENHYPSQLSGGMQQRVGIARSLAVEPELWFLDEPFSALDPLIRREMQDEFIRLQALLHKTIVFITHDFDEAIRLADRIAVMKDGEVIQVATPEQLVLNPATDYVEEFTRHIPRSKIVTIGSIMSLVKVTEGEKISASATVDAVSKLIVESKQALPVIDDKGQIIGSIGREAVINVLVNGELN
jgi:glycine betaine/proline transport system ATP-binding protein